MDQSTEQQLQQRLERIMSVGAKMRAAQIEYFKFRGKTALETAKRYEHEFDKLVAEGNKSGQSKQAGLF